jgi:hypothetical protein
VGAVSEGLLHFTQGFLVLVRDLAVTLERNLEGAHHSLDAVGVRVDGLQDLFLGRIYLV